MNRQQRRRAEALKRRIHPDDQLIFSTNRGDLLGFITNLANADETVSGVTLITPDGEVSYLDADRLRQGGRA